MHISRFILRSGHWKAVIIILFYPLSSLMSSPVIFIFPHLKGQNSKLSQISLPFIENKMLPFITLRGSPYTVEIFISKNQPVFAS